MTTSETQRLKLLIAYDGHPFRGWQSQASRDAVQDLLERAFTHLCDRRIVVHGSGRTDTGVHALGQVAHADVPRGRLPREEWAAALNGHLPPEIRVLRVAPARPGFHSRFNARGKIYVYRIWNAPVLHPFEIGRAWHVRAPLDLEELRACAALVGGTHDFAGFAANRRQVESGTIRTLRPVVVRRTGSLLTLRFEGDGFLYKMVRLLTGTLVRCAQRRAERQLITTLLAGKGRTKTSFAAPAHGLYLMRVRY